MLFDPRSVFLLIVLVGVTGWVARGLLVTWYNLNRGGKTSRDTLQEMEERLRKVETATSGLIIDVTGMREKERFMARLQAGAASHEAQAKSTATTNGGPSPMETQNIPIIPRAGRPR
jgi:hypothetical protein